MALHVVTRDELRHLLRNWQAGDLTPEEVEDWATQRVASDQYQPDDTVTEEVLNHLDILGINLTVPDDIPMLLAALDVPPGRLDLAAQILASA